MADEKQSKPKTAKPKDTISDKAHQKTEELKDKAFVEITRLTRILIDKIGKEETTSEQKRGFFYRNGSAIQAISAAISVLVTIALACFAYSSWREVKKQRELSFKQFVVANLPSVMITALPKPTITDSKFLYTWRVVNLGGPVRNISLHIIMLGINFDGQGKIQGEPNIVIRTSTLPSLIKEFADVSSYTQSKESLNWIREIMDSDISNKHLVLAFKVFYDIPEELTFDNKSKHDSKERVVVWDKAIDSFTDIKVTSYEMVLDYIKQKNLWEGEDRG